MITAESFPTPDLAQRTLDSAALAAARAFAAEQTTVAEMVRRRICDQLADVRSVRVRTAVLQSAYVDVTPLAVVAGHVRLGTPGRSAAARRRPIPGAH
ncbi:hypothetical protein [Amycolatopsis anabasis]|uniref:hypothetical protein n=1 Tax=Amycolatopsis anabasis TaxID=1840409 RepID=UPI00131E8FC0|nr:hypothetical protein [Amycolatopsis anabasis]